MSKVRRPTRKRTPDELALFALLEDPDPAVRDAAERARSRQHERALPAWSDTDLKRMVLHELVHAADSLHHGSGQARCPGCQASWIREHWIEMAKHPRAAGRFNVDGVSLKTITDAIVALSSEGRGRPSPGRSRQVGFIHAVHEVFRELDFAVTTESATAKFIAAHKPSGVTRQLLAELSQAAQAAEISTE